MHKNLNQTRRFMLKVNLQVAVMSLSKNTDNIAAKQNPVVITQLSTQNGPPEDAKKYARSITTLEILLT